MTAWRATVWLLDEQPAAADLIIDVGSLQALRSEGGLKALSGQEVKLIQRNALKSLNTKRFPQIRFHATHIEHVVDGEYRATGTLEIHGTRHERVVEFHIADRGHEWQMSGEAVVRQTEFGIKPYSLFGGTLKVEDSVRITVDVRRAKD
jgi:polyisoprenoid-binding protein YceI